MEIGDLAFELFEEHPRVGRIIDFKNNVVVMDVGDSIVSAHMKNFRLATSEEISKAEQQKQMDNFFDEHCPKNTDFI